MNKPLGVESVSFTKGPLVSIIVPVWNVEEYIERCVRSVLEQTYSNLEFVFVDDGSTDDSVSILLHTINDYPDCKDKVLIFSHGCNKGLPDARNTGVFGCHGDLVYHVDPDDWLEKNAVELMVKRQVETGADIITARAWSHYEDRIEEYQDGGRNLNREDLLWSLLTYMVTPNLWLRLIKRSLYLDYGVKGIEGLTGAEDFQVLTRLVYYSQKHSGIDDFVYHYNRYRTNSVTNGVKLKYQIQAIYSVRVVISFFADKEKYWYDLIAGRDVFNIHERLINSVHNKNRLYYNAFLRLMKDSDSQFWYKVGWDNAFKRWIDSHYYPMMLYQYLRPLFRFPLSVFYRFRNNKQ